MMKRSGLYSIVLLACISGFIWLGYTASYTHADGHQHTSICPIKSVTQLPCPSCGSSRAILSLFQGDLFSSLYWNPLGLISLIIMSVSPIWIGFDMLRRSDSFFTFYQKTERIFRLKWVAIPAVVLIIANWIWNIAKDI